MLENDTETLDLCGCQQSDMSGLINCSSSKAVKVQTNDLILFFFFFFEATQLYGKSSFFVEKIN